MHPVIVGAIAAFGTYAALGTKKAARSPVAANPYIAPQKAIQKELAGGASTGNPIANQLKPNLPNLTVSPAHSVAGGPTLTPAAPAALGPTVVGIGTVAPHWSNAAPLPKGPVHVSTPPPARKVASLWGVNGSKF